MYKVFIDNKPIIFQINPESELVFDQSKIWENIRTNLKSNTHEIIVELQTANNFDELFSAYEKIEAAGGLVQREDAFLFIKRNGLWDIPKGKLEKGETPEIGAIREIEEECGLKAPVVKMHLIDTWHTYVHKNKNVLKRTYWYWLDEGSERTDLVPQTEEGITEVRYFPVDKWSKVKKETFASIVEVMDELEKKLE